MFWPAGLINVYGQENVRITGKGIIDGNGKYWWDKFWGDPPRSGGMWTRYAEMGIRWAVDYDCKRVRALVVYDSRDVLLKDFTVQRSGFWTVTMTYCERVHVDGIVIRNNIGGFGPSSDGINTDSSRDILVENCDIDCNDDNLCIKAGRDADGLRVNRPAENIVYRNSITRAGHGLFTLGSETSGGIRNVEVYGLRAVGTNTGIRFKSARVRGGTIENIWFHDIEMERVVTPFSFELDWYPDYSYPVIPATIPADSVPDHWTIMTTPVVPAERGIPQFRDLRITRVTAIGARQGFYVNAFAEKPISNVHLEQVALEAREPGVIRHARDWTMKKVTLSVPGPEKLVIEDCQGVEEPVYIFRDSAVTVTGGKQDLQELLLVAASSPASGPLILYSDREGRISRGDTLKPDTLQIIIVPGESGELTFSQPLGDGYYYTPVSVRWDEEQRELQITSELSLHCVVFLHSEWPPERVDGAEGWVYQPDEKLLVVRKTGTSFRIDFG
jgi:hypothetical protein